MAIEFATKHGSEDLGAPTAPDESRSPAAGSAAAALPKPAGEPSAATSPAAKAVRDFGGGQVRQRLAAVERLKAQLKAAERDLQEAQALQKAKDDARRRKLQLAAGAIWFKLGLNEQDMTELFTRFDANQPDAIRAALGIRGAGASGASVGAAAPGDAAQGDSQ